MTRTQLYIAGPMTGLPDFNYPAFHDAAKRLRDAGFEVFSPAENGLSPAAPWHEHMRIDLAHLVSHCYAIATLPEWGKSRGASIEVGLGITLDMQIQPVAHWLAQAGAVLQPTQEAA